MKNYFNQIAPLLLRFFFAWGSKVFGVLASFFVYILIARRGGPVAVGEFVGFFSVVYFLGQFSTLGTDVVSQRILSNRRSTSPDLILVLFLKSLIVIISFVSILFLLYLSLTWFGFDWAYQWMRKYQNGNTLVFFSSVVSYAALVSLGNFMQGAGAVIWGSFFLNILSPFILLSVVFLYDIEESSQFLLINSCAIVVSCLLFFLYFQYSFRIFSGLNLKKFALRWKSVGFVWLLSEGRSICAGNASQSLILLLPIYYMELFSNSAELGKFSVVQKITSSAEFFLIAANALLSRRFALLYKQEALDELLAICRISSLALLLVYLPMFGVFVVYPDDILKFFGKNFVDSAFLFYVLATVQLINLATGEVGYLLIMINRANYFLNSILLALAGSVAWLIFSHFFVEDKSIIPVVAYAIGSVLVNSIRTICVRLELGAWPIFNIFKVFGWK